MHRIENLFSEFEERPIFSLAILLVLSLLIKGILIYSSEIINPDGVRYINSARELLQGNIAVAFAYEKMLGFTFLLGLTHLVIPDWFLAAKVLSGVALVSTTIPLYLVSRQLFGRRAAFFTALVFTVAPVINGKCASVIKDPSFLFLIILSLWFVIYAQRESLWGYSLLAGIFSALSTLIRPEGIVFFLIVAMFLTVSATCFPVYRRFNLKSLAAFCLLPSAVLFLAAVSFVSGILSPELLSKIYAEFALYFQTDPSSTYREIYQHLKRVEENFPGGQWTNDFFEYARYNMYLVYLIGMLQTFCQKLFPVFILPLIFGLNLRGQWNKYVVLLLTVLGGFLLMDYLFLLSRNFISGRYFLVPVTLSFILVGYGMKRMVTFLSSCRRHDILFVTAIILCVLLPVGKVLANSSNEETEIREAGIWLREHRDVASERMIVNDERIAFYAGLSRGNYDIFRDKKIQQVERIALQKGCEIIVIYRSTEEVGKIPSLGKFALIEKIPGRKKVAMIYERKT